MKKLYIKIGLLLVLGGIPLEGSALTALRDISTNDHQVRLTFDRDLKKSQIRTEFFRDIIQISIRNSSVYPAKIKSPEGEKISKVFAYQYTPSLVRCRITVKGDAENYQNKVEVRPSGNTLEIVFNGGETEVIKKSSAQAERKSEVKEPTPSSQKKKSEKDSGLKLKGHTEEQLLSEVLKKEEPNPLRAFWWLGVALLIFGAAAMFLKRGKKGKSMAKNRNFERKDRGLQKISGFLRNLPVPGISGGEDIEVVTTRYLGPKRQLTVIRVKDRFLLLGVTQENIRLITEIDQWGEDEVDAPDQFGSAKSTDSSFQKVLSGEATTSPEKKGTATRAQGIRESIRNRIDGMKPL